MTPAEALGQIKTKKRRERKVKAGLSPESLSEPAAVRDGLLSAKTQYLIHQIETDRENSKYREEDLKLKKRKLDMEEAQSKAKFDMDAREFEWKMLRQRSAKFEADSAYNHEVWKKRNQMKAEDPSLSKEDLESMLPFKKVFELE